MATELSASLRHSINYNSNTFILHKINKNSFISTSNFISSSRRRRIFLAAIQNYKQYDFQDFHGYARPSRLLEATEPKVCTETSQEKECPTLNAGGSRSLFKVKLQTSNAYGSSLSDQNAGVLLCLIDTNGDSILQRIPMILKSDSAEPLNEAGSNAAHFQRGSLDEFTFEGPKLERIEALWVSIESGQWRLGDLNLTVVSTCQSTSEETIQFTAFQYEFQVDDILLGDQSETSVVELRPNLVSEFSGVDPYNLLFSTSSKSTFAKISNEESMREYADLKLSLLSYDAALIFVGTIIADSAAGETSGFAFFIGGICGFSYLLLLQRSVDGLPASPPASGNDQLYGEVFKGAVFGLAVAIGFAALAVKYGYGDFEMMVTPKEVLVGTMGFLACKVAVVLAAFKPISMGLKENE